jgi:hypothetical protein
LTLLKLINQAKQLKPVIDALNQATLNACKPESIVKPATFDQRRKFSSFADLSGEDATNFRLYLIKLHRENLSLPFWFEFMQDLKHDSSANELKLSLIKAGLENAPDDETRAIFVQVGWGVLDIDNVPLRQKFLDLVQPYRDSAKYPQTMENIRMFDTILAFRTGKTINLDSDLTGFGSDNATLACHLKLRALIQKKDLPKLKSALNGLSADQMVSPMLLSDTVPGLEAVGMQDEAALARDTLTKQLHQDVLSVWFTRDGTGLHTIEDELMALGSTQDLPKEFTTFVQANIARQQGVAHYQLVDAYLDKDWNAASTLGAAYTQTYPDYYTDYWFLGRSLAEMGKKDDAIKALTVYCQYSLDEIWYPDAKDLLDKLTGVPR